MLALPATIIISIWGNPYIYRRSARAIKRGPGGAGYEAARGEATRPSTGRAGLCGTVSAVDGGARSNEEVG